MDKEIFGMVLVGVLWGFTNPLLREGYVKSSHQVDSQQAKRLKTLIPSTLRSLLNLQVLIPYALNQLGSVAFYFALAKSDISRAVPICNGLALVFSCICTYIIGEPIRSPMLTLLGASLVSTGTVLSLAKIR